MVLPRFGIIGVNKHNEDNKHNNNDGDNGRNIIKKKKLRWKIMLIRWIHQNKFRLFFICILFVLITFWLEGRKQQLLSKATQKKKKIKQDNNLHLQQGNLMINNNNDKTSHGNNNNMKSILYYTSYWDHADFQFGIGRRPFIDHQCPINTCVAYPFLEGQSTNNNNINDSTMSVTNPYPPPSTLGEYDAVLFSATDFKMSHDELETIQSWRQSHQRFIMLLMESPSFYIENFTLYNGFFNWTMTYRWDSDIPRPYGWFHEKETTISETTTTTTTATTHDNSAMNSLLSSSFYATPPPQTWKQFDKQHFQQYVLPQKPKSFMDLAKRPKQVAWIVSHCDTLSKREDYVRHLQHYNISIDIFGSKQCHPNAIPCDISYSTIRQDNCTQLVEQDYKFYLSFENALCNDYVTEKFFKRIHQNLVIVLGQANYTKIAPPHSHLNIMDYSSPKELANYINYLDENPQEYLSYFWWQDYYQVFHPYDSNHYLMNGKSNFGKSMCQLCQRLHKTEKTVSNNNNYYNDMVRWWRGSAECGKMLNSIKARLSHGSVGTLSN